jgi:hypothetical protein
MSSVPTSVSQEPSPSALANKAHLDRSNPSFSHHKCRHHRNPLRTRSLKDTSTSEKPQEFSSQKSTAKKILASAMPIASPIIQVRTFIPPNITTFL